LERTRLWIQTLALAGLAVAALVASVRGMPEARAAGGAPMCAVMFSDKAMFPRAIEHVAEQAAAWLSTIGDRPHVAVLPVGRDGSIGIGTYSVICAW
jgi:hypothetical protein